jgi:plastocyanin
MTGKTSTRRTPKMKTWITPLLAAGSIAVACYPALAGACESDKDKLTLEVTVSANGERVVSPDRIHACRGDEIKWKFKGEGAREFAVKFASDSPFDWKKKREKVGKTLKGTVRADAAAKPYDYMAEVDGEDGDPVIVIDP